MSVERHPNDLPVDGDDDIRLVDVYHVLVRRKHWVIGVVLVAVVVALAYVSLVSPEWQASAVVQVGQVGGVGLVESPARTVERMKQGTFENAVLTQLGIPLLENNPQATLFKSGFKIKTPPNTDVIQLELRAKSVEEARRQMEAVVATLQRAHARVAEPSIIRLKSLSTHLAADTQKINKERERLLTALEEKSKSGAGDRFSGNVLIASILQAKDTELRALEERRFVVNDNLDPAKTYPTLPIEAIHVSEEPVYPKKTLIVLLSGLIGLIVGVMSAFIGEAIRRQS